MTLVAGCRLDDIAAEAGTPVLVVSEDALRARAREYADGLTARWPRSRVVFASKAFPCTAVQRVMVEEGLGLDVAGGGEIVTALRAGVDPAKVVLHGNAKGDEEIAMAVEHGLGLVVVDGADDLDRLEAALPAGATQDVLVRVIPGVEADTHASVLTGHAGSKFGVSPERARELIARIEASPSLRMRGVHAHVGSQIMQVEPFAESVAAIAALGEFPVYDLGGGLGARYTWADRPPSVAAYLDALVDAAREPPPRRGGAHHRAGPQHGRRDGVHRLPGRHREARGPHVRGRRRRDGRQPRGRAVRAALRGRGARPPRRTGRGLRPGRPALRER